MTDEAELLGGVVDGEGRILEADAGLVALLGPVRDDVIGAELEGFLSPDLRGRWPGRGEAIDWWGRRADGLPWCAALTFSALATHPGEQLLAGRRRFGPLRWATDDDDPVVPSTPGIDSVVSHDIRGALRGGSGFVTVVKRAVDDPEIGGAHERLAKAGDHLAIAARSMATADEIAEKVVHHLRWSARPFALRRVRLDQLIRQAGTLANEAIAGPLPSLRLPSVGSEPLPAVLVDPEHVRWAFAELITNASKFGSDTVTVTAEASGVEGYVDVAVRDEGIGIEPGLAEDAFLPGRKLQARGDYPGVGMGLALCRVIFERHSGRCRVAVEDAPAVGTAILCRLPSSPDS